MKTETINLNKLNTKGTWTAEFDIYEYGRTLTPKQRSIFFRLQAEIANNIARRMGYQPDASRAGKHAVWACEMTNWKSIKAAMAIFRLAQQQGYCLT